MRRTHGPFRLQLVALVPRFIEKSGSLSRPCNEAYFPRGPNDPELALVRVPITHADYWDAKANKLVQLYRMARAAAGGRQADLGDRGQVRMH